MIKDVNGLLGHVYDEIRKQTDIAVIGLSGGADSTLVALLCVKALGKENVYGIHMPYDNVDYESFNMSSINLAHRLGIGQYLIPITDAVQGLTRRFGTVGDLSTLNTGNMRSRMRMVTLYTACCHIGETTNKRSRVIGTGNLSEDYIGYDTKGGDALADFFPIGNLLKSEVYQLLEHFRDEGMIDEEMINRIPSAGLWKGQTDEDELGHTYAEMEPYVLALYSGEGVDQGDELSKFVWERHINNKHKHEGPPAFDLRVFCDKGKVLK